MILYFVNNVDIIFDIVMIYYICLVAYNLKCAVHQLDRSYFFVVRQMSQDGRSPSPTKLYAVQSPVSPGGSSGFSSRRSSQDGFHLEELSPVQQQLSEINNRYGLLGVRLADRQAELDSIREEVKKHLDNLRTLSHFLDKVGTSKN